VLFRPEIGTTIIYLKDYYKTFNSGAVGRNSLFARRKRFANSLLNPAGGEVVESWVRRLPFRRSHLAARGVRVEQRAFSVKISLSPYPDHARDTVGKGVGFLALLDRVI
jgi:hypothetical protein